jgi:hypothetical protein
MKKQIGIFRNVFSFFLIVSCLTVLTGCHKKMQALFTKPRLSEYERLAVIGLNPEQEQIFMASYTNAFHRLAVTFVERNRLRDILSEQDLLEGRLNDRTRAKIKQILGVEALILCHYYDADAVGAKKLRVRIVDSETGAIVGSVITRAGDNFEKHCDTAIKAIKEDLTGASYYEPPERKKALPRR